MSPPRLVGNKVDLADKDPSSRQVRCFFPFRLGRSFLGSKNVPKPIETQFSDELFSMLGESR